jgi:hypothetical protein
MGPSAQVTRQLRLGSRLGKTPTASNARRLARRLAVRLVVVDPATCYDKMPCLGMWAKEPPMLPVQGVIGKHLQCDFLRHRDPQATNPIGINPLDHGSLISTLSEESIHSFVTPIGSRLIVIEIGWFNIRVARRNVIVARRYDNTHCADQSPRALHMEGVFPDFHHFSVAILHKPSIPEPEHRHVGSPTCHPHGQPDQRAKGLFDLVLHKSLGSAGRLPSRTVRQGPRCRPGPVAARTFQLALSYHASQTARTLSP